MYLPCLLHHLSLLILLCLDVLAQQCNTPGFVPCPPNDSASGSNSGGGSDISGSGSVPSLSGSGGIGDGDISPAGSAPVDSAALDGIQGGDDSGDVSPPKRLVKKTPEGLEERQSTTFCCRPAPVQCLVLNDGLPACYDPSDTRYFFPDDSYYFSSNNTFYFANGSSTVLPASVTANAAASSGALIGSIAATTASAVIPGATEGAATTTNSAGNGGTTTAGSGGTATSAGVRATTSLSSGKTGSAGSVRVDVWVTFMLLQVGVIGAVFSL